MAKIDFLPPSWGGTNTSKDYDPLMALDNPLQPWVSLAGEHAIDTPNQNLTDPVVRRYVKFVKGRLVDREQVIRPADQLSLTMTVNFGMGLETPLLVRARRGLRTTLAARRVCPEKGAAHAYIWPNMIPNPPSRVNAPITIEDTVMAQWQAEFRADEELVLKEVGLFGAKAADSTVVPIQAVAFLDDECVTSGGSQYSDMIAVGGDGTGAIYIRRSTNRFTTSTAATTAPAPTGSIGTSIFTMGDVVLVGFSTHPVNQAQNGTAGGTLFSSDGGVNFALDVNITPPIYDVAKFGNVYIAVGGVGAPTAGAPYFGVSTDGLNWTQVSSPAFPATGIFTSVSVDEVAGKVYVLTRAGALFVGVLNGGNLIFSPITLPTPLPSISYRVHVLAPDTVAVAGSGGYYAEMYNGGSFVQKSAGAGSSDIRALAGGLYRTLVGAAAVVNERTLLSDYEFARVLPQNALTNAAITCIAATKEQSELNFFAASTVNGEILLVRDFSPYT